MWGFPMSLSEERRLQFEKGQKFKEAGYKRSDIGCALQAMESAPLAWSSAAGPISTRGPFARFAGSQGYGVEADAALSFYGHQTLDSLTT